MKKILVSAVLVLTAVFAFAAGNKEQMGDKTIVLRLGDNHPDGYPTVVGDLEFARLVKERSNGRIVVEVYNNGVLGDQKSVVEQVQFGGIDFVRTSISSLAAFYPDINVLQAPYLFRNADHIVVLGGGTVIEQGAPEDLMAKGGEFARMVKLQQENNNEK